MTDLPRRSLLQVAGACAALPSALLGCGKPSDALPVQAASPSVEAAAGPVAPLKIGFVYVGPVADGGWSFAHDQGRQAMERALGDRVQTHFVESVPESADAERVLRELASQGHGLIFGTTYGYTEALHQVASAFPAVRFAHATGPKAAANVRTYDSRTYEGAYLAGIVAGAMTKSRILGVVGSVPIPEVLRNINSFTLGAQSVNPRVRTRVVWVNEWFSPPKETEAATALIRGGADVLFQNTDSPAVLQTAQRLGRRAFGWNSDMRAYAPRAHLASAVIDWGPYYVQTALEVLEGRQGAAATWWGMKEGAIGMVSIADDVPAAVRDRVAAVQQGLREGRFAIWKGPILGQDRRPVLGAGRVADDVFLSGIRFYVHGVEGRIPKGAWP
ncbi:MAG: BMP family ABC transporter substrate-binding protein [Burkholderiaceae bacterium]|nr:BMP family ABC transporter substrate-binding protein [Burkholderiaceae bacterium]